MMSSKIIVEEQGKMNIAILELIDLKTKKEVIFVFGLKANQTGSANPIESWKTMKCTNLLYWTRRFFEMKNKKLGDFRRISKVKFESETSAFGGRIG